MSRADVCAYYVRMARQAYRIKATAPVGSIWHSFGRLRGDISEIEAHIAGVTQ